MTKRERTRLHGQAATMEPKAFKAMLVARTKQTQQRQAGIKLVKQMHERELMVLLHDPNVARYDAAIAGKPVAVPYRGSVREKLNMGHHGGRHYTAIQWAERVASRKNVR